MSSSEWKPDTVTEVLKFETLKSFREDTSVCEPACRLVMTADGAHQPHHYGKQEEDPRIGYIICDWDNYEDHEAVLNGPLFPLVRDTLLRKTILSWATTKTYHAILSADPAGVLNEPFTEVTYLTLKVSGNRNDVTDILTEISQAEWAGTKLKFVFGVTIEDNYRYMALWGWESVEARTNALKTSEAVETLNRLWSLAENDHDYLTYLSKAWLCK